MTNAASARALPRTPQGVLIASILLLATTAGALVAYKASAALATIAKSRAAGSLAPKAEWLPTADFPAALRPLVGALNYFGWVFIALTFGVVLGAMVKAFVPRRWLAVTVGAPGLRGQLLAALVGAPLMLCSCCVAPLFEGVYERTRRLGPAIGLMFASPALNPAALVLTFVLFPPKLAWARLVLATLLVLGASASLGSLVEPSLGSEPTACAVGDGASDWRGMLASLKQALGEVALRSLPAIALGVIASVALLGVVPLHSLAGHGSVLTVLIIAAVALPVALPTFGEIPIGVALLHAGAPEGAVLALLLAGPAINLPSLFTLKRVASLRVAAAAAAAVFGIAVVGGLVVQMA